MPPSCLGRYRVNLLMSSRGDWFYKNLNSKEIKALDCLGEGRIILDGKKIFGRRCWLKEITLEKRVFGVKIGKSRIGKRANTVLPVF